MWWMFIGIAYLSGVLSGVVLTCLVQVRRVSRRMGKIKNT